MTSSAVLSGCSFNYRVTQVSSMIIVTDVGSEGSIVDLKLDT